MSSFEVQASKHESIEVPKYLLLLGRIMAHSIVRRWKMNEKFDGRARSVLHPRYSNWFSSTTVDQLQAGWSNHNRWTLEHKCAFIDVWSIPKYWPYREIKMKGWDGVKRSGAVEEQFSAWFVAIYLQYQGSKSWLHGSGRIEFCEDYSPALVPLEITISQIV